jgi:hypothetical protein
MDDGELLEDACRRIESALVHCGSDDPVRTRECIAWYGDDSSACQEAVIDTADCLDSMSCDDIGYCLPAAAQIKKNCR